MNNIRKIIEYGLYLLVFLSPLQTRWIIKAGGINGGYWEYGTISLYITDILLIIILLFFIAARIKKLNFQFSIFPPKADPPRADNFQTIFKFLISNYWFYIAIIELSILVSIFFAPNKLLAVYGYVRFLLGVGLFWLIVSAEYNKIKLICSLIAGATIQAGLGIWQFITQSTFSSKWLGIAVHKAEELGTSVVETAGKNGIGERWLRAYGGLDHPNMLGGVLVVVLLLLIILYINRKPEKYEKSYKILNFKFLIFKQFSISKFLNFQVCQDVLCVMCYVLCAVGLFFTFSRAAWLGLAAGLLVMIFFMAWQKDIARLKKMARIILAGIAVIFILSILYNNLVFTRIANAGRIEVKSNIERVESYKFAQDIIKKDWLFGAGAGNYTLALKNEINLKRQGYYYQPVHNIFLLIWAEAGLMGLLGFIGLLGALGRRIKKMRNYYCLAILFALTVMMIVDHWLWSLHFGMLFFWMVMGLIVLDFSNKECYNNQVMPNENNQ